MLKTYFEAINFVVLFTHLGKNGSCDYQRNALVIKQIAPPNPIDVCHSFNIVL